MSREPSLGFTYQDYLLLPEDKRYEIVDGHLFMTPAPGTNHQRLLGRLYRFLDDHIRAGLLGEVLISPCDVVLSDTDIVQPDLLFIAKQRQEIVGQKYVSAAPDLVVEILSESTAKRDRGIKAKLYERAGVNELWIVDPWEKTVEIFVRGEGGFFTHARFASSDTLVTPTFPGLEIPLSEVF